MVRDRGAQSVVGMHGLGRCAWSRLGGRGPARIGKLSLGWGCTVWDDVHGPGWEDMVRDRGAQSGMGMHSLGWGCMIWDDVHGPG